MKHYLKISSKWKTDKNVSLSLILKKWGIQGMIKKYKDWNFKFKFQNLNEDVYTTKQLI